MFIKEISEISEIYRVGNNSVNLKVRHFINLKLIQKKISEKCNTICIFLTIK